MPVCTYYGPFFQVQRAYEKRERNMGAHAGLARSPVLLPDVAAHFHIQFKISLKIGAAVAGAAVAALRARGCRFAAAGAARQRLATVLYVI